MVQLQVLSLYRLMSSPRPCLIPINTKNCKKTILLYYHKWYFSRFTKRRVVGGLTDLIRFLETVYIFYFLLAFYFRILFLHTTDFNPRIYKDIIIIIIILFLYLD